MNELRQQIEQAIQKELGRARKLYSKHGSIEESYVVLRREFRELDCECEWYSSFFAADVVSDWDDSDLEAVKDAIERIKNEALEVAAMARRLVEDAGFKRFDPAEFDVGLPEIIGSRTIERYLFWIQHALDMIVESFIVYEYSRDSRMLSGVCWSIEYFVIEMLLNTGIWEAKS